MRQNHERRQALIAATLVALSAMASPAAAVVRAEGPQARPGERVRVTTVTTSLGATHEDELVGVLQSTDADGLTILGDAKPEPVRVPAPAIRRLEVSHGRQRPGWAMPALIGGGALLGAMTGALVGAAASCNDSHCASDQEISDNAGTGAGAGAVAGAVGGLIGSLFIRQERWEPASLPDWAHTPKLTLGLVPVRRGVGLRVSVAF